MFQIRFTKTLVQRVIALQIIVALVLGGLSLTAAYFLFMTEHRWVFGLVPQFYADDEGNIPNWYSAQLILLNSGLLAIIAFMKRGTEDRFFRFWALLSFIFMFLSIDELTSIHGMFEAPVKMVLPTSGLLYSAWVIPYAAFAGIVGILSLLFLKNLPRRYAVHFMLAGALYVSSTIGMEMIEGPIHEMYGTENITIGILASIEETLEMLSMTFFCYSILSYIAEFYGDYSFGFVAEAVNDTKKPA